MRTIGISILFIILFIALSLFVIAKVPTQIQASIKADIEDQYLQNNIQDVEVILDGRDVTLMGEAKSQEQLNEAINIASHRPGVRVVMIETVVKETTRALIEPMPETFNEFPELK
ncbi:MAG: BON domain-containing protein [Pseudomonadota bacterium]